MARHRSPRGQRPKPNLPTPEASHKSRRRGAAHRLPAPALGGAAVVGAVAAGAVAASGVATSQTVTLVSAAPDLPVEANTLAAGTVPSADRAVTEPAAAPRVVELSTVALEQDPANEVQALAKGVALAEEQVRPKPDDEETDDEPTESSDACPSFGFNGVAAHVARAGHHLQERFGVEDVGGVAKRPGNPSSDHPRGYALDFMVDRSTGDALAAYAEEHAEELGIKYILWRVANHYDHVHISFTNSPGSGLPC